MATNKTPVAQLQRRGGKRVSVTASYSTERPSGEGFAQSDSTSHEDELSITSVDSPCIDMRMPSPSFDVPGLMSSRSESTKSGAWGDVSGSTASGHQAVDETTKSPYMNSPGSDFAFRDSPRTQQAESTTRGSPLVYQHYEGSDGQRGQDSRSKVQDRPSPGTRNMSTSSTSLYDRSLLDDASQRAPTAKKSRLNLLNPMSLLARRRSSQHGKLDDVNVSPLQVPAIPDFDPSIRGNIVHDFSAPRVRTPRREPPSSPAQQRHPEQTSSQSHGASSPALHSPMFKEHFQEESTALQPAKTAYLHNQKLDAPSAEALPAFAQKLPANLPPRQTTTIVSERAQEGARSDEPPTPPPKATPPTLSTSESLQQAYIPKHMKSTSSRFSFQISGQGSAQQEKILEERHRERFPYGQEQSLDADEDDFGDYDFEADDGLEESIPGINSDFNEYEEDSFDTSEVQVQDINLQSSHQHLHEERNNTGVGERFSIRIDDASTYGMQQSPVLPRSKDIKRLSLAKFHFTPQSSTLSPTSTGTGQGSEPTPRDSEGFPIGIAGTRYSPSHFQTDLRSADDDLEAEQDNEPTRTYFEGLRINTGSFDHANTLGSAEKHFDDEDLYFDDGEFGSAGLDTGVDFDEELLDDENHIRDIPAENEKRYQAALQQMDRKELVGADKRDMFRYPSSTDADAGIRMPHDDSLRSTNTDLIPDKASGLTEGNLAAYHDALAMAANNAAANGRFDRQVSFSETSNAAEDLPWSSSQSGLVSDESRYSVNAGPAVYTDDDTFPFDDDDDDLDDDLMIAEANAEALENDEDGFYGQEFGFYARAYGKDQPDLVNGGYFTSRGSSGIKRSHSGKANFQEPSLTPITERSEWSARNSVVSLQFLPGMPNTGQSLPSPGLNQLMESPAFEDEMSLSALIKLRRGAFGGSSTSINSMGERNLPSSSPLAHVSGYKFPQTDNLSGRMTSSNTSLHASASILESEEEEDDAIERATMTQNTPRKMSSDVAPRTPEQSSGSYKIETPITSRKSHHSRNSSGAESVSYARDDDGRWILERRRAGDDGELELIAREYLDPRRI